MPADEQLDLPQGIRITPQRRALLETIARSRGPFTALELAGREPRAYVPCHPGHHHHLVCGSCGDVQETEPCGVPPLAKLAGKHGRTAKRHEPDIDGTCACCTA